MGTAVFDRSPRTSSARPIVITTDAAIMTLDPVTFALQNQFPPHRKLWTGRAALVGRIGDQVIRADWYYAGSGTTKTAISALGHEEQSLVVLAGNGSFFLLHDGRFAYVRYDDSYIRSNDLVLICGLVDSTHRATLAVNHLRSIVPFGEHIAIAHISGVRLYEASSLRPIHSVMLADSSILEERDGRLIVVHANSHKVSELSADLGIRSTITTERRVSSVAPLSGGRLVVSSQECDESRGEVALYDMPSQRIIWRSVVATSPGSLLEHGDVLLVGNGACGGDRSGFVYVLDIRSGRVVDRIKLPSSGVGEMLA